MKFTQTHKVLKVELVPLIPHPSIDFERDEAIEREICPGITDLGVAETRRAIVDLRQWELIVTYKDTENLAKLKDLGYKEGQAVRILDALGLE